MVFPPWSRKKVFFRKMFKNCPTRITTTAVLQIVGKTLFTMFATICKVFWVLGKEDNVIMFVLKVRMSFWCLKFSQKVTQKFGGFLP